MVGLVRHGKIFQTFHRLNFFLYYYLLFFNISISIGISITYRLQMVFY
jgi:hypothetical protein